MSNDKIDQVTKQAEALFAGPARSYAALALDHYQNLASAQFEAAKTYSDVAMKQARAALEIKDPSEFKGYVESQQKVIQSLGELVQKDAAKLAALNETFAREAQKLVQENVQNVSKAPAK